MNSSEVFRAELDAQSSQDGDALRLCKRLLHFWGLPAAMGGCWRLLENWMKTTPESGPGYFYWLACLALHLPHLHDELGILYACHPQPVPAANSAQLASLGAQLRTLWEILTPEMAFLMGAPGGRPSSVQMSATSEQFRLLIERVDHLQAQRVPPLVRLSVAAVRTALDIPIEQHLELLLAGRPAEQQPVLRAQILLADTLGAHALLGVEDAFASVQALESNISLESFSTASTRRETTSGSQPDKLAGKHL